MKPTSNWPAQLEALGEELFDAMRARAVVEPLSSRYPALTIDDAYCIQQVMNERRLAAGERIIGHKIGLTSKVVMQMLGVDQPDFGVLTDAMLHNDGATIDSSSSIQPKAEGEIAFLLKRDLCGPGVSAVDVLAATEGLMACFEIVDSRVRDWKIKIQDTIADNASCGALVLGGRLIDPRDVDLVHCGMVLEKNGEVVATGAGAAAMGSPANAVAWLANALGARGVKLKAGEVILSGSLAAMVPAARGDNLRVEIGGLGTCSVRFG